MSTLSKYFHNNTAIIGIILLTPAIYFWLALIFKIFFQVRFFVEFLNCSPKTLLTTSLIALPLVALAINLGGILGKKPASFHRFAVLAALILVSLTLLANMTNAWPMAIGHIIQGPLL